MRTGAQRSGLDLRIDAISRLGARSGPLPGTSLPVSRLYNGRWAQNESNHRYTTKASIVNQMVDFGVEK